MTPIQVPVAREAPSTQEVHFEIDTVQPQAVAPLSACSCAPLATRSRGRCWTLHSPKSSPCCVARLQYARCAPRLDPIKRHGPYITLNPVPAAVARLQHARRAPRLDPIKPQTERPGRLQLRAAGQANAEREGALRVHRAALLHQAAFPGQQEAAQRHLHLCPTPLPARSRSHAVGSQLIRGSQWGTAHQAPLAGQQEAA